MVTQIKSGKLDGLKSHAAINLSADGNGPMVAMKRQEMGAMSNAQRAQWMEKARLDALLGGTRFSLNSLRSGLRCYIAFVGTCRFE